MTPFDIHPSFRHNLFGQLASLTCTFRSLISTTVGPHGPSTVTRRSVVRGKVYAALPLTSMSTSEDWETASREMNIPAHDASTRRRKRSRSAHVVLLMIVFKCHQSLEPGGCVDAPVPVDDHRVNAGFGNELHALFRP